MFCVSYLHYTLQVIYSVNMSDNGGLGCAMSGLIADSRTMVEKGRLEAQHYWFMYNEPITIQGVTQAISNLALQFGEDDDDKEMSRPFGTALLIGGVDEKGPQLYHLDPSGTYTEYDAKAIGSGFEGAQTALQELYNKVLSDCQWGVLVSCNVGLEYYSIGS
jgi:20S proteasome subunit alpha 5